jgi:maltose alpha-D-glucosyltransferase/alpha-amylase
LANLFDFDAGRIAQAFSIMLTLPGTPIIYYGDEYGKRNDDVYFNQQSEATGYSDTRYYVRGPVDWVEVEAKMQMSDSFERKIFDLLAGMLSVRNQTHVFGEGTIAFIELNDEKGNRSNGLLSYIRKTKMESYLVVHNLNPEPSTFVFNKNMEQMFEYGSQNLSGLYTIAANGFIWLRILNTM